MYPLNILSLLMKGLCCYLMISTVAFSEPLTTEQQYGPVQAGDILWNIAGKTRPSDSINRYQMMLALFQANPTAFKIACNLNSLIVGRILAIPSLATIQAIEPQAAKKLIEQQNMAWKNYRRQGQTIDCTDHSLTTAPILPALVPPQAVIAPPPIATETVIVPDVKKAVKIESKAVAIELPQKTSIQNFQNLWISLITTWQTWLIQPVFWLMVILLSMFLLLLMILIIRLFRQIIAKPTPVISEMVPHNIPFATPPAATAGETMTATAPLSESPETTLNKKLDIARESLAQGETRTAKTLLQEVMDQGNQSQRREARQLFEINQQMSTLELNLLQVQRMTTTHLGMNTQPLTISQVSTQRDLPGNKAEMLNLVDKIFKVLDQELDTKGKLLEAYQTRHQPEFLSVGEYQPPKKPEKILVEQETPAVFESTLRENKTSRYL